MQEEKRYIENPFKKIVNIINPDKDKLYSLLFNLIQQFIAGSQLPTLVAIASDKHENEVDISAYTGVSGYLYTLIRLFKFFSSKRLEDEATQEIIESAVRGEDQLKSKLKNPNYYLQLAQEQYGLMKKYLQQKKSNKSSFSFLISETSIWLCGMQLAYILRDNALFRDNQRRLFQCYNIYTTAKQKFATELLYGTPGFLYVFLELQQTFDHLEEELFRTSFGPISKALTMDIINEGIRGFEQMSLRKLDLNQPPPQNFRLVYQFHKTQYLGGAHGLGGNLNLILLSFKLNKFGQQLDKVCPLIGASIFFLLKHLINGNFSTRAGSQKIKLVHFCHGAPGIVSCLARFMLMFPEKSIQLGLEVVIKKCLDHIWEFGVLKKGFGLCHGISGNAYAFIAPSIQNAFPQLKNELLKKAILFALLREQKEVMNEIKTFHFKDRFKAGISDNPYSLMLGVAGDICFTIDTIEGVGSFPGFDF